MQIAPIPPDEAQRLQVLHESGMLDSANEENFDALVRCIASITGCPIALVCLIDSGRQWFKAAHGLDVKETPRDMAFCAHTILQDDLLEVSDAACDPRFAGNRLVTEDPHIRFYAGVPLTVEGMRLGTLCVIDRQPRQLSADHIKLLRSLAEIASDLIESRRHLLQLKRERERMGDFARASGDWMWEVDADFRCTWLSESFEAITQIPVRDTLGKLLADSPLLDAQGEVIPGKTFLQLLAQQQPFVRVTTLRSTSDSCMQVSRSAVPCFDDQGRFAGFRGTARDVSESIRIHKQLAAQDQLLRKLSSQVPGVIFQYHRQADGTGRYAYVSDAVRELLGIDAPAPGRDVDSSVPYRMLHPDDRSGYKESIAAAYAHLKPWLHEYRVQLADGRVRWMETRASPEPLADGGTLWHGFTADVTERKQTELALRESRERVEMASEAAGIGIVELDLVHGLVVLDRRACVNHGLRHPQAGLTVQAWMDALHREDRAEVGRALQAALNSGEALELRYRACFADGRTPTLEMLARGVYGLDGKPSGLVGTCRDISAALMSQRLQREKEAAERANRAKSEFLSRVSHELRTPLNGILGFAQLMQLDRAQPLQGDQQRRLDSVLRAGRHLLDLINEVLDLSRIESEDFSLQAQPVDVGAAVQACLNLVQPLAEGSGVRLPCGHLPAHWVLADPRALEQVLMNLLSNAIKYNRPHGAVHITAEVRGGGRLVLSLRDEGLGLSSEQQAALFQPFNRLGVEGSGLGLVISRDLMRAMGGTLQVSSQPGQGATFSIDLPLSGDSADAGCHDAPAPPGHAPAGPPSPERTVLYVEDEPLNVILMQEIFRQRPGWTLRAVTDGAQGLQAARELRPDLVLIDMNLPDMSGLQLLKQLRGEPATRGLRCVALSADALPEQISDALAAGFSDYWTKPIDVTLMLNKLSHRLAG
jgi:PAS domain S-box-containing protein